MGIVPLVGRHIVSQPQFTAVVIIQALKMLMKYCLRQKAWTVIVLCNVFLGFSFRMLSEEAKHKELVYIGQSNLAKKIYRAAF